MIARGYCARYRRHVELDDVRLARWRVVAAACA
jgi:hypothetical protein